MTVPGAQLKLVGADAGHYEHEEFVDEVLLAPSERVVLDVLFPDAGELELQHRTPERTYRLASITVADEPPEQSRADEFGACAPTSTGRATRAIEPYFEAPPDKTLSFVAEMDMGAPEGCRRLCLPDAPGGGERGAWQLPEVRDETARPGGRRHDLCLSDASGGDERHA